MPSSTRKLGLALGLLLAAAAAPLVAQTVQTTPTAQSTPAPQAAASPEAQRLYIRSLAATCAHCHGTEGRPVESEAFVRLAGQSRDYLLKQLLAFRSGERKATIMHQITRGYSEQQLEALASYFAAAK
jgi:cytochrome subunit of sulfide dehydrogenase